MAAEFEVAKATIQNWEKEYPEFLAAMTRAMTLSQAWWEKKGQECLVMPAGVSFQASAWSRSMAARFPDDWREKTATEHSGPDGGPIKAETVTKVTFVRPEKNNGWVRLSGGIRAGSATPLGN